MDIAVKLNFEENDPGNGEDLINCSMLSMISGCDTAIESENCANNLFDVSINDLNNSFSYNVPNGLLSPRKEPKCNLFTENNNSDSTENNNSDSPPYKRIRALRLFESPATPKTLLEKCAADSTSANKPILTRFRSKIQYKVKLKKVSSPVVSNGCVFENHCNKMNQVSFHSKNNSEIVPVPIANINPFTPVSMNSRKRRRLLSKCVFERKHPYRDTPVSQSNSNFTTVSDVDMHGSPEFQHPTHSEDRIGEASSDLTPPDRHSIEFPTPHRLSIHDANVSRYHEEFLELGITGKGQFGTVYKCRHRLDGCIYAIKKSLKPVAGSTSERIALNEVYAHAVLGKHPHVVRYYSAWAENDHMIIQNEYCTGGSLADAIVSNKKTGHAFTESQLKQILLHVAKGLKYIHNQQLVHMDIKPGNIFISREPQFLNNRRENLLNHDDGFDEDHEINNEEIDDVVYKIGDLGHVTSILDPQVEEGDCRYLPREILQEDFSHLQKADIFALGLTLYECASGRPLPLNGDQWHAIRDGNFKDIFSLSNEMKLLLRTMIHPDPKERPQASQLIQQLSMCHTVNKSHAELRRELNAERLKNELLSRKLQEAAKCLQSISPNVTSTLTAAVVTGVLAGVGPVQSRNGPMTRNFNARLVGKRINRSISNANF